MSAARPPLCTLQTGYREENSQGNSSLRFWECDLLTYSLLSKLCVFSMDKYNVDGASLLTLRNLILVIRIISHFYTHFYSTDANDLTNPKHSGVIGP